MKIVYTPEGADPIKYDWEPYQLQIAEVSLIERHTGQIFEQWRGDVERGSGIALHAFLWVMQKRDDGRLRPEQVMFTMNEIDFELTDEETRAAVASLRYRLASEDLGAVERSQLEATADALELDLMDPLDESGEAEKAGVEQAKAEQAADPKAP